MNKSEQPQIFKNREYGNPESGKGSVYKRSVRRVHQEPPRKKQDWIQEVDYSTENKTNSFPQYDGAYC